MPVRLVLLTLILVSAAGCARSKPSGESRVAPKSGRLARNSERCLRAQQGFRICRTLNRHGEIVDSGVFRKGAGRWAKVVDHPLGEYEHWWTRLFPSPDGRTLLLEWQAPCDMRFTYLVPARGGELDYAIVGGANTRALGWSADGRARVRLITPSEGFRAGIYRIDPVTHAIERERAAPAGTFC
jgi:hypothetical protein